MRCPRVVSRWFNPLTCGLDNLELSQSYSDMASKLCTFTWQLQRHNNTWNQQPHP